MANEIIFLPMEEWFGFVPANQGEPLAARLCIQMTAGGKVDGQFRFAFCGEGNMSAEIGASSMAYFGGSLNYRLAFEFPVRDVIMSPNMLSTPWTDLEERLVAKETR